MKNRCKKCGDSFKLTAEEASMVNNGEIDIPQICDECYEMENNRDYSDISEFSDADPGL